MEKRWMGMLIGICENSHNALLWRSGLCLGLASCYRSVWPLTTTNYHAMHYYGDHICSHVLGKEFAFHLIPAGGRVIRGAVWQGKTGYVEGTFGALNGKSKRPDAAHDSEHTRIHHTTSQRNAANYTATCLKP